MNIRIRQNGSNTIYVMLETSPESLVFRLILYTINMIIILGFLDYTSAIIRYLLGSRDHYVMNTLTRLEYRTGNAVLGFIIVVGLVLLFSFASLLFYLESKFLDSYYMVFNMQSSTLELSSVEKPKEVFSIPFSDIWGLRFATIYHKTHGYGPILLLYLQDQHPVEIKYFHGKGFQDCQQIVKRLKQNKYFKSIDWISTDRPNGYYLQENSNLVYGDKQLLNKYRINNP